MQITDATENNITIPIRMLDVYNDVDFIYRRFVHQDYIHHVDILLEQQFSDTQNFSPKNTN